MSEPLDDDHPAWGAVVETGRGSLPFALVHGEALVAAAAWALGEAGVQLVDLGVTWDAVQEESRETGAAYVLHDSLCPLTPPGFLADCVREAVARDAVVVGVREVTDTVKRVVERDGVRRLGATLDRSALVGVCSPLVLPASVVAALPDLPGRPGLDLAVVASLLGADHEVVRMPAPPAARRVASPDDIVVLEALAGPR